MKIIKKPDEFNTEILCRPYNDNSGRIWGRVEDYCGAMLRIDKDDICYCDWRNDWYGSTQRDYGVICPCCGSFIQLPLNIIPKFVRDNAISYEQMKSREEVEN